jgi:LDH2 family malate/lactate/ureidoglycolate dehydrogenase
MVFTIGLLAAALSATSPPWELYYDRAERGTYGTVLVAFNPRVAQPFEAFAGQVDRFIETVKAAPPADDGPLILYPGERSQSLRRERWRQGDFLIPELDRQTLAWLAAVGGESDVDAEPVD